MPLHRRDSYAEQVESIVLSPVGTPCGWPAVRRARPTSEVGVSPGLRTHNNN